MFIDEKRRRPGRPEGTKILRRRYMTAEELERFMKAARRAGKKYGLLFALTYYYALRVGEVVRLKLTDFNLDQHQLTIRPEKSGRERTYDLHERIEYKYKRWLDERAARPDAAENPFVFPHLKITRTDHMTKDAAQAEFRVLARKSKVGMPRSVHDLRHSRAQEMIRAGDDLATIKKWLRHRDIASSKAYLDDEEDSEHEKKIAARSTRFLR